MNQSLSSNSINITITATFTADPIEKPLRFWMEVLGLAAHIEFAPYNQVFQQLLDPASLVSRNTDGLNVVLVRLDDWSPPRFEVENASQDTDKIQRNRHDFVDALRLVASKKTAPLLVILCPSFHQIKETQVYAQLLNETEEGLVSDLARLDVIYTVRSAQLLEIYPVSNYHDSFADRNAKIPYTQPFFAVLATIIARKLHALRRLPFKVIVLDCDNTLWSGVCAEDGPMGVKVDQPRKELQQFVKQQKSLGMLLCLCSKNNENDVRQVFVDRPDMILQYEDFVCSQINWRAKSQNIQEMAEELQLGLDAFILLDDNPVECAEVEANCPGTLALTLPSNQASIPSFLKHVWAFDHLEVTQEDHRRTELYKDNIRRQRLMRSSLSFCDFIDNLELEITIKDMQADQLTRCSQLTLRTNQFNLTTIRRRESELRSLWKSGEFICLEVEVQDRFGDYGLVGLIIYSVDAKALRLDTFLLSCRVLGRGVEHHMLARMGEIAQNQQVPWLEVKIICTEKNRPALDFMEQVAGQYKKPTQDGFSYVIPSAVAAACRFNPPTEGTTAAFVTPEKKPSVHIPPYTVPASGSSAFYSKVASELSDLKELLKRIDSDNVRSRPEQTVKYSKPRNDIEHGLAKIFASVLRMEKVGIDDDFFRLGGNSLMAMQILSRIREEFGVEIEIPVFFEEPTIAALAPAVEQAKQKIDRTQPLVRVTRPEKIPASFSQQRLWFVAQLDPDWPVYNIPVAIRLDGKLDHRALEKSINAIIKRHEILRTSFLDINGEPYQVIAPQLELKMEVIRLTDTVAMAHTAEIRRWAFQEGRKPFNLMKGPLIRAVLLQVTTSMHVLLLTLHHMIADGWSLEVLYDELGAFYNSIMRNKPSPLHALPLQYADFAIWQRNYLQENVLGSQLEYWKEQLRMPLPSSELPTDHPRPATGTFNGDNATMLLPKKLTESIKVLCEQENVTTFMLLLAAYNVLLYRHSGQKDILVGTTIANRNRPELECMIGFFANTLVMRTRLSGNTSFRDLLVQVRETSLEAFANQDMPFERLVVELQPERDISHNPLFQVFFSLQNTPAAPIDLDGLTSGTIDTDWGTSKGHMEVDNGTSKFDLSLYAVEKGESFSCTFEYNTDLFDADRIQRMLQHFQILLDGIVSNPDRPLYQLPLLTPYEREQLLVQWNDTRVDYPQDVLLHNLFEAQVERSPDAVALDFEGRQLSYSELNRQANQLAHYLQGMGVGPDTLVGILMERSVDLVLAIYGVVKAGGAYVPIDPNYPEQRVKFMLENACVSVLLTQEPLASLIRDHEGRVVYIDGEWEQIEREETSNPTTETKSDNLAYMIFTSGSTGSPKGAMNTHRGICNRLLWMQDRYGLTEKDRVLQKTPFSFDVSVWEFFWPLFTGARLVVAKPDGHRDAAYLVKTISNQEITVLHFVPSMLQMFLEEPGVEGCRSLRHVICSGEALPFDLQEKFFGLLPAKLHNLYGPTEAAVDVTHWICKPHDERGIVPIGRPVANTQIYVLDEYLQPVPIGVPGELYIGGVQVGRGYYNRPDLTAERFISDPFSGIPNARLYKTGDRCRWLNDGSVEFLGRYDYQVKVRGFRIELGEIEVALAEHPTVKRCVVVVQEDKQGMKRLIAYVEMQSAKDFLVDEMREKLRENLPEFMIPSAFVYLDKIPTSPNGKVDRSALPKPEVDVPPGLHSASAEPTSEAEQRIAEIWQEVLELDDVGRGSNFFDLGGDSLRLMRVRSKLQLTFGCELEMVDMFRYTTISTLAQYIEGRTVEIAQLGTNRDEIAARRGATARHRKTRQRILHGANGDQ